jgi:hypothetical protein
VSAERLAREIVQNSDGKIPWDEALREAWFITLAAWDEIENAEAALDVEVSA